MGHAVEMDMSESTRKSIQADLDKFLPMLGIATHQSGRFEWIDGMLIRALENGEWLLIDNVNFCNPTVLDRLNGLLEPNGVLILNERGLVDGALRVVKPHPNFRLFMTMDPLNGEISRAMRNRGIELYLLPQTDSAPEERDLVTLLASAGLVGKPLIKSFIAFDKAFRQDSSASETPLSLRHLLSWGQLSADLVCRGFPFVVALQRAAEQVYLWNQRSLVSRNRVLDLFAHWFPATLLPSLAALQGDQNAPSRALKSPGLWPKLLNKLTDITAHSRMYTINLQGTLVLRYAAMQFSPQSLTKLIFALRRFVALTFFAQSQPEVQLRLAWLRYLADLPKGPATWALPLLQAIPLALALDNRIIPNIGGITEQAYLAAMLAPTPHVDHDGNALFIADRLYLSLIATRILEAAIYHDHQPAAAQLSLLQLSHQIALKKKPVPRQDALSVWLAQVTAALWYPFLDSLDQYLFSLSGVLIFSPKLREAQLWESVARSRESLVHALHALKSDLATDYQLATVAVIWNRLHAALSPLLQQIHRDDGTPNPLERQAFRLKQLLDRLGEIIVARNFHLKLHPIWKTIGNTRTDLRDPKLEALRIDLLTASASLPSLAVPTAVSNDQRQMILQALSTVHWLDILRLHDQWSPDADALLEHLTALALPSSPSLGPSSSSSSSSAEDTASPIQLIDCLQFQQAASAELSLLASLPTSASAKTATLRSFLQAQQSSAGTIVARPHHFIMYQMMAWESDRQQEASKFTQLSLIDDQSAFQHC